MNPSKFTPRATVTTALKLGAAAASLWAIGLVIATSSVSEDQASLEVSPAEADIVWTDPTASSEGFAKAMAAAGLEPRPYDLNGNVMYFANGRTKHTPRQVEAELQKLLVRFGVNSDDYTGAPIAQDMLRRASFQTRDQAAAATQNAGESPLAKAMLNGEVVPIERDREHITMSSIDYGRSTDGLLEAIGSGDVQHLRDLAPQGYRHVEARYEPESGMTDIVAVWTGDGFDAKKMDNTAFKPQPADPEVPSCMGCERQFRFQSLGPDEPFRANRWNTGLTLDETYDFYVRSMAARGWRESGAQQKLNKVRAAGNIMPELPGRLLNFEKEGRSMQIVLLEAPTGGTMVMSQERYSGANSIIPRPEP